MRVRSLKQVLHWLFLAVGVLSVVLLALSVNTYVSYAREGYGLDAEFDRADLHRDGYYWLRLRLIITNPGSLNMFLDGGTLTLASGNTSNLINTTTPGGVQNLPVSDLPKHEEMPVVLWFRITQGDYNQINSTGQVEMDLDLEISVPERYMSTHLIFIDTVEVSP